MTHRHLILRVFVTVTTAAAVGASGASAMPKRDTGSGHTRATHHSVPVNPARIDAAAHAATMRAIGAKRTARTCA